MKKFLIIKTSALGDVVQTYPVVSYLKSRFPDCQIDWVIETAAASLVQSHPDIRNTFCIDSKAWRRFKKLGSFLTFKKQLQQESYDAVFDLQGNIKSGLITWLTQSKNKIGFGFKAVPEWPNLLFTNHRYLPMSGQNIRLDYLSLVQQFFKDDSSFTPEPISLKISEVEEQKIDHLLASKERRILVCPGSAWPNKCLTQEALVTLLKQLNGHCYIIWGNQKEKEFAQSVQNKLASASVVDRMTLPSLQRFISKVDLVIAMDSLPLHLAGTTSTPSFSVFGASSATKYQPIGLNHHSFQGSCPYGIHFDKRCPKLRTCKTGACIHQLTGNELFAKINQLHL